MLWKPSGGIAATPAVGEPDDPPAMTGVRHPSCLAVAMRYLMPVADDDEAGTVTDPDTDPDTGLTFGYLRYTETSSHRIFVTVECLYGYKKAIGDGLKRIVKP